MQTADNQRNLVGEAHHPVQMTTNEPRSMIRMMGLRALSLALAVAVSTSATARPLNVLMIAIDDLRPEPG